MRSGEAKPNRELLVKAPEMRLVKRLFPESAAMAGAVIAERAAALAASALCVVKRQVVRLLLNQLDSPIQAATLLMAVAGGRREIGNPFSSQPIGSDRVILDQRGHHRLCSLF